MLRRVSNLKNGIVTPPYLYGSRSPLVAGIIRRNDEISEESKRVLEKSFFSKNDFLLSKVHVDAFEVVSDESVHRAHDPTHLEAGVGVTVSTRIKIGNREIPCAIVMNCLHVGVRNDFKNYHANQARLICQDFALDTVGDCGLVLSVGDNVIKDPFRETCRIVRVNMKVGPRSEESLYAIEKISDLEKIDIFARFITFPDLHESLESFALVDKTDVVICGISRVPGTSGFTDAFVTMDCPTGSEKRMIELLASKIMQGKSSSLEFATSDKHIAPLFDQSQSVSVSAMPVGLTNTEQEIILRNPMLTSGSFHHLFDPLDYS